MWETPLRVLPAEGVVVVCIDDFGIYCAKRERQTEDSEWMECNMRGQPVHVEPPHHREPLWWQHLPGGMGRPKRNSPAGA